MVKKMFKNELLKGNKPNRKKIPKDLKMDYLREFFLLNLIQ